MNDIVTRLRRWVIATDAVPASDLMDEAADLIESLMLLASVQQTSTQVAWERSRLTDAERQAVEWAVSAAEDCQHPADDALRGLLERLSGSAALSDAGQTGETGHAPEPTAIPPAWLSRPYWVDPPSGWRYGFPRLYHPQADGDMTEWLIANGYPERLARQGLACTFTAATETGET